jgi:hypothetical protein
MEISNKILFIHHGAEKQPTRGAKGGVAILLSEEWSNLWRKGGCAIRKRNITNDVTARPLAVDILIIKPNKPRVKPKTLILISTYHPHSGYTDEETNNFNQSIADLFDKIPKNNIVIMGADLNLSIRTRTSSNDHSGEEDDNTSPVGTLIILWKPQNQQ